MDHLRSVERAARILKALSESGGGAGVTEIAHKVDLGKSTTHRLLTSLCKVDLARLDSKSRRYTLGYGLLQLAAGWHDGLEIRAIALPHLQALRAGTRETVSLNVRDGDSRVAIERLDTSHEVRFVVDLGRPLPLYSGASGKAILAFLPETEALRIISAAPLSPRKAQQFLRELERVRRSGVAQSKGERVAGTSAVSAPIFIHEGKVVGSVSILSLESRTQAKTLQKFRREVKETALRISRDLGSPV